MTAVPSQFGGRVTFTFNGWSTPIADADVMLDPAIYTAEVKTNQDGSPAYMLKPKQPGAEFKLRISANINWKGLLLQIGNCTIREIDNNVTHLFTNTRLTGTPKHNLSTGEIDGLKIEGGTYSTQ
jgi:hypothetical protein